MLDLFKKYLKYLLIDYPQGNTSLLQIGISHQPLQALKHLQLIYKTPWKEFRVESRNEALCALGKTGRTGLQIVRHFWSWFYEPKILIFFSSYLEKHQNPSWWHRYLMTKQEPSAKKKKKIGAWLSMFPLHQNHLCTKHLLLLGLPRWLRR